MTGKAAVANRVRATPETREDERRSELLEAQLLEHGPAWDDVANRTALARFHQISWRGFCQAVQDLPSMVRENGMAKAHSIATGQLLGMLYTMAVAPPATTDEARTLDRLRLIIVHPALFRQLALPGAPYDRVRQMFLAATARAIVRPAVPIIFRRSAETWFENPEPKPYGIPEPTRTSEG